MSPIDFLFRPCEHADRIAIESATEDVTYAELRNATNALAVALQSKDPIPGSTVALCAANSASYIVAMLAVQAAGKDWLPLDYQGTSDSIHSVLDSAMPTTVFVDENGDRLIHADSEVKISFSQFPGLVQTYFGQMPVHPQNLVDEPQSTVPGGKGEMHASINSRLNSANAASQANEQEDSQANRLVISMPIGLDAGARIALCLAQGGRITLPDSN